MLLHGLPRDRRQRQGRASNLSGMVGDALVIRKLPSVDNRTRSEDNRT